MVFKSFRFVPNDPFNVFNFPLFKQYKNPVCWDAHGIEILYSYGFLHFLGYPAINQQYPFLVL